MKLLDEIAYRQNAVAAGGAGSGRHAGFGKPVSTNSFGRLHGVLKDYGYKPVSKTAFGRDTHRVTTDGTGAWKHEHGGKTTMGQGHNALEQHLVSVHSKI